MVVQQKEEGRTGPGALDPQGPAGVAGTVPVRSPSASSDGLSTGLRASPVEALAIAPTIARRWQSPGFIEERYNALFDKYQERFDPVPRRFGDLVKEGLQGKRCSAEDRLHVLILALIRTQVVEACGKGLAELAQGSRKRLLAAAPYLLCLKGKSGVSMRVSDDEDDTHNA